MFDVDDALRTALDALEEVLSYDKGMDEPEWIEFGNRILPFMQAQGRIKDTVGFS